MSSIISELIIIQSQTPKMVDSETCVVTFSSNPSTLQNYTGQIRVSYRINILIPCEIPVAFTYTGKEQTYFLEYSFICFMYPCFKVD